MGDYYKNQAMNKKQKLFIGISGKMGVGKSTITDLLIKAIPNAGRLSFAEPLYRAQNLIYREFGLKLRGDKDRDLLIALGQWGRDIHSDFWVGLAAKAGFNSEFDVVICDDIRFPNEANFFKKHGILIRIEGEQRGDNVDTSRASDATECALDDYKFEHIVKNDQSPEDMCMLIAAIMLEGKDE